MTVAEALREAAVQLAQTSDTARLDAELLMAHALERSRSDMLLHCSDAPVPPGFAALIARRKAREPVAYITGRQEFYGRAFRVSRDVLIPRGDSEVVVEAALKACSMPQRVLDLGTGSGALLLTVLAERAQAAGWGVDNSQDALHIAQSNADELGLGARAQFAQRDWREAAWAQGLGQFDLILCNPPYVETGARLAPDIRDYEPRTALFAGSQGLDDYCRIFPALASLVTQGGVAVFEIGASQAEAVCMLACAHGFASQLCPDLAGRARAVILRQN